MASSLKWTTERPPRAWGHKLKQPLTDATLQRCRLKYSVIHVDNKQDSRFHRFVLNAWVLGANCISYKSYIHGERAKEGLGYISEEVDYRTLRVKEGNLGKIILPVFQPVRSLPFWIISTRVFTNSSRWECSCFSMHWSKSLNPNLRKRTQQLSRIPPKSRSLKNPKRYEE